MFRSVADGLKAGTHLKPKLFLEASVYFSDIDDFASIVAELSPLQRHLSLTSLYSRLCLRDTDVHCRNRDFINSVTQIFFVLSESTMK